MNKMFLLMVLTLAFNLTGFSQRRPASQPSGQLFSISGSIVSKPDKSLLSRATIKFQKFTTDPVELMNNQIQTIKTDANGRWSFKNLSAGEYQIVVSAPDVSIKTEGNEYPLKLASVTKILKIDNADLTDMTIELPVESSISGAITVKGENQNPEFTYIIATDERQGIVSGSEIHGRKFYIRNLSAGDFFLNLTVDENYHVQAIKLGNEDITSSTINLRDGQNLKNVEIVVSNEVGTIKGKINGFRSDEGILIVLLPIRSSAKNSLRSSMPEVPDENGEFNIEAPTGEYLVAVVTSADMARRDQNNLDAWFGEITLNAQKVVVYSNQSVNLELNMPK